MLLSLLASIGSCPAKMLLISEGRSGSSATMLAIGTLTHSLHTMDGLKGMFLGVQTVGSNLDKKMTNFSDPTSTMEAFYHHTCKEHPGSPLMGFKLKPYIDFEPG